MAGFCHKFYEIRLRILSNTSKINDGVRQIKFYASSIGPEKRDETGKSIC